MVKENTNKRHEVWKVFKTEKSVVVFGLLAKLHNEQLRQIKDENSTLKNITLLKICVTVIRFSKAAPSFPVDICLHIDNAKSLQIFFMLLSDVKPNLENDKPVYERHIRFSTTKSTLHQICVICKYLVRKIFVPNIIPSQICIFNQLIKFLPIQNVHICNE